MKRIETIASLISSDNGDLLDIGSDHGYLPLLLLKGGFSSKLYASENKLGPFNNLTNSLKGTDITCLFGDGLEVYQENIKQVVIAGMGGRLISKILDGGKIHLASIERLILEPQTDEDEMRRCLNDLKWKQIYGVYIKEKGHIYPIEIYVKGEEKLSEDEIEFGKYQLNNKDLLLKEKLNKKIEILSKLSGEIKKQEELKLLSIMEKYYEN
ncbi:MAG: SAM-dependent methyltransferase [Firmicutes bacterium]|uniref:SAM-dependent methyltransferase n=1 Tax=Candidatus Scatoplasma merdavium TaxID=2840932 RepID=A0A9D9GRP8_9BACL|nr:SAM-dependent methyltransferase [Candidatus Scatoplasma merdavium]